MDIPLPKIIADVGEGGPFATTMRGLNALTEQNLKAHQMRLENQYYPKKTEAEIAYKNALANESTRLLPHKITEYQQNAEFHPHKLEHQKQTNQLYTPKTLAEIGHNNALMRKLESDVRFAPLVNAVNAQRAMTQAGRSDEVTQYLRSFSAMTAPEKELYLANPENNAFHQRMMKTFQTLASNPSNKTNLLTPELLGQYYNVPSQNQLSRPVSNQEPTKSQAINNENREINQPASSPEAQQRKDLLLQQNTLNNKQIDTITEQRANASIALEKWLQDNRNEYAPRLQRIVNYSGTIGRGKKWIDQSKSDEPEVYSDYLWFKNVFGPNLTNQIKMMEKLGATDSQKEELQHMVGVIDDLAVSPKTALKNFNKSLKTFNQLSQSVIDASEPGYKGVRKELAGLNEMKGDYISLNENNNLPSGMVRVKKPDGSEIELPEEGAKRLIKDHPNHTIVR